MAYIKPYTYDIFLSYAHVDNLTTSHQKKGWIEQFYEDLKITLAQRIGRLDDIAIWWDDKKLDGNVYFNQSIEESIRGSAIMFCFLSQGYMRSEYCQQELDTFYRKIQTDHHGLRVGDRSRLFNVRMYNIPHEEWPPELKGTTGFPFFQADSEEDWGNPLDVEDPNFQEQFHEMREGLVDLIERMIEENESPPPPPAFSIFFGDVSDSLGGLRKRTVSELEKQGYHVICDVPPPYEKEEHEVAVQEKMESCFLNVHLLSQFPGREIEDGELLWYPQKQVEIGLLSQKPQLIWMPADTNIEVIEEEQYKTFLRDLEGGKLSSKKIDIIRGSKSELTQQIVLFAESLKQEMEQTKKLKEGGINTAVLLDTHKKDQSYAWEVGKSLLANGVQAYINPAEDDPTRNVTTLEERMSEVSRLVFFYGTVAWEWVMDRMTEALKIILTKSFAVQEFVVFLVPPHKDPDGISLKQGVLNLNVMNYSDAAQLDTTALQQFIQSIKRPPHER